MDKKERKGNWRADGCGFPRRGRKGGQIGRVVLTSNACKGSALLKVFNESIDIAEVFAQQVLLVFLTPGVLLRSSVIAIRATPWSIESANQLARTPL
jgi:hypothetical protein